MKKKKKTRRSSKRIFKCQHCGAKLTAKEKKGNKCPHCGEYLLLTPKVNLDELPPYLRDQYDVDVYL